MMYARSRRNNDNKMISTRAMYIAVIYVSVFIDTCFSIETDMFNSTARAFHSELVLNESLCDNSPIENLTAVSVINCMIQCGANDHCLSFSISRSEELCWLHTTVLSSSATGHYRGGTKCYNMKHDVCEEADDDYVYDSTMNFCFKEYDISAFYNDAKSICLEDRAYLLRLENLGQLQYLMSFLALNQYLIQSTYNVSASQWQFEDQTQNTMTIWPNPDSKYFNPDSNSSLVLNQKIGYFITPSDTPFGPFICQKFVSGSGIIPTMPTINIGGFLSGM